MVVVSAGTGAGAGAATSARLAAGCTARAARRAFLMRGTTDEQSQSQTKN